MPDCQLVEDPLVRALGEAPREDAATMRVSVRDVLDLLEERDQLRAQVKELQDASSKVAEASLHRTVRAFHFRFGHPVEWTPRVPDDATMRFRLRLIAEEFFEVLHACLDFEDKVSQPTVSLFFEAEKRIKDALHGQYPFQLLPLKVDLPELVDGIEDLKYVLEGTHATCGVNGNPVAAAIHGANMAKDPNGPDGKPVKPAGWKAPDVRALLVEQGWVPPRARVSEDDHAVLGFEAES